MFKCASTEKATRSAPVRRERREVDARLGRLGLIVFTLVALALLAMSRQVAAETAAPRIDFLTVSDAIDPMTAQYVKRGLAQAAGDGASAVLIELNTPGGLDGAMRDMTGAMLGSPVPVIVYVTPAGARAGSAGVFILMAADVAAMAPGTNVGAAHPVDSSGDNVASDEREKVTNDAAAYMRTLATKRHHNAAWAESAVRQSVALTADEARQQGVVDLVSPDRAALLAALNGRTLDRDGQTITLRTRGATVVPIEMTVPEQLLHLVDDPNVAYLLLTVGFWAILAELFHPGSLLPGIAGVLCLALALTAFQSLPLNWTGLVLILGALGLFILDLKAPTHGALTAAGVAVFVVGSLMLFAPVSALLPGLLPTPYAIGVHPALVGLLALGLALFFAFAVRAGLRARHRPALSLLPVAPGLGGVALTDLHPSGRVRVKGMEWTATADGGTIRRGDPIEIVDRQGMRLVVRRSDDSGTTSQETEKGGRGPGIAGQGSTAELWSRSASNGAPRKSPDP